MFYCALLVLFCPMMACVLLCSIGFCSLQMGLCGPSSDGPGGIYVLVLAPAGSIDGTVRCWDTRSRRFEAIQVLDEASRVCRATLEALLIGVWFTLE